MYNPDDPNTDPTNKDLPSAPIDQPPAAPAAPAPVSPYNREQFRDQWMQTGTDTTKQNALLGQYGFTPDAAGRVNLPTDVNGHAGETLDLRIGAKSGQNLAGWTGMDGGGPAGGTGSGIGGAVGGASGNSATGGSGFQDQIRTLLMQMLKGANGPVDPNSADIKQPFDAASLDAQRQLEAEQKALAESQYATGNGSSSNELQQGIQQSRERTAVGLAGIKGQLIQRAALQKQQQLQQALSLAVQSGDAEAARAIQMQIAQMDNALRAQGLSQQASQWNDSYGLNVADAQYQRDRDAARAKAGLPF